ncbi:hypothetical protein APHAL10511_006614 [Amanita phalloides]|nr:hypothetical protein APHAL10511_006614 [Amanita phalloides]
MQKHLILSVLLAFALVAMCAPAVTLARRSCARRSSKLSKTPSGGTSRAPSKPPSKPVTRTQSHRIGRRAPRDISLCGISIRGHSASACQGNPGYVEVVDKGRKVLQWRNWRDFSPAGNECDHLVELQLIKAALESIGFCRAWNGMIQLAASEGHVTISAAEQTALFSVLKDAANDNRGMHYLFKDVNGEKEHFVGEVIRRKGAVQMRLAIDSHVVSYIQKLATIGDTVAANIDRAALAVLKSLYTKATSAHKAGTSQENKDLYACALMEEMETATGFDEKINAVSTYWGYLRRST